METRPMMIQEQEINLLELLIILLKRKRLIIGGTIASALIAAAVCFIMSPIYEGTTKMMPPQQSSASAASALMGQLGGAASILLGAAPATVTGDLYVGLMQTDAVLEPIIKRFDLSKLYEMDTLVDTKKYLRDDILKAEADIKSGIISVTVQDEDPQRAADMANAFVEELKKLLENLAVTDAAKRRLFFEQQLKKAQEALTLSEQALQSFQEDTGVLKIDDQAGAMLQGISVLKAQITAKEVQADVMRGYATQYNPDLKRLEEELQALKGQLKRLEEKQEDAPPNVLIPTGAIPNLGMEYIRKMRDFKYNETLYELLVKQYEAARLEEAKDAAIIQVINRATAPDKKAKPKLVLTVIAATAVGLFLFTFAAFVLEFVRKASEDPENEERFKDIKKYIKKF